MALEVTPRQVGDATILDLAGDLVRPDCAALHGRVKELLRDGTRRLALNLERVGRVDETGLGTLSSCHVSVLREFSVLSLLSPAPQVHQAIWRYRLDRVVNIYSGEEEFLDSLRPSPPSLVRSEGLSLVSRVQQTLCYALWAFLVLVLVVLWMQLSHPAAMDRLTWLVLLEESLLSPVRAFSDHPAPALFYLIVLLFVDTLLLIYLDSHLQGLRRLISR